jgi:hypothetical protein
MSIVVAKQKKKTNSKHIIVDKSERLRIWKKARGLWKSRKPDPIKELQMLRDEWR